MPFPLSCRTWKGRDSVVVKQNSYYFSAKFTQKLCRAWLRMSDVWDLWNRCCVLNSSQTLRTGREEWFILLSWKEPCTFKHQYHLQHTYRVAWGEEQVEGGRIRASIFSQVCSFCIWSRNVRCPKLLRKKVEKKVQKISFSLNNIHFMILKALLRSKCC